MATRTFVVKGPMTIYECVEIKRELTESLAQAQALHIDLSAVDEMDTAGLQLLLLARREATRQGKEARLIGVSAESQEVLDRYQAGPYLGWTVTGVQTVCPASEACP